MNEPTVIRFPSFRFSLRALLVATFLIAVCVAVCVQIVAMRERSRRLTDPDRWPRPIQTIVKQDPSAANAIKVYDLQGFLDETKLVSISGHPEIVSQLINDYGLVQTNNKHRHSWQIFDLLPNDWQQPQSSYVWHTSQGFGSVHQEGVDLFLIATDPATGDAVILYNWIF